MEHTKFSQEMPCNINISKATFQQMVFITNSLNQGWTVKKKDDSYIFTKKHENKREVFKSDYLETFIESNLSLDDIY